MPACRSYRLRYRTEDQPLSTALFPGNEGLCLQPDETLRLVEERAQSVPVYRTLLPRLCNSGGGGALGTLAGASLLALMVVLAATVLLGAARLRHGSLPPIGKRWWRWWRGGYMPAQLDGIASQPCGKEGSRCSAVAAAATARFGGALPLNVRPGRRMGPVLHAVELAQASARTASSTEAYALGCQRHEEQPPGQPPLQQQPEGDQRQALGEQLLYGPLRGADGELPPLPLLPSTALVLPQHEGQPLMLGRTSRSMVSAGGCECWLAD